MAASPSPRWPFVGRRTERDAIVADLRDPDVSAAVLTAPAGAGKTRLARELQVELGGAVWIQASEAVAGVPFGALVGALDPSALLEDDGPRGALAALDGAVAAGGGLVVLDDAPHLDARTADLLQRLVATGGGTVLATAREGEPVPAAMEWLWLDEATRHHALGPLAVEDVDELTAAVLGSVEATRRAAIAEDLLARTGGNALFLRELLADLRRRADRGEVVRPGTEPPGHLLRVLDARLREAGSQVTATLHAVAVLGSLPLDVLVAHCGAEAVDAAASAGCIVVGDDLRSTVRPAHPLYAEAALAGLGAASHRRHRGEVARRVVDDPGASASERLAAVAVLLEVGEQVEVRDLVAASRTAFSALDHDLAVRVAEAAVAAGDRFEARIVLGAAHSGAGRTVEAEAALRGAVERAVDDDERARSAGRLSVHLVAHGTRLAEADEVLRAAEEQVSDPRARAFLRGDRAKLAAIRGDIAGLAPPAALDAEAATPEDEVAALNAAIGGAYVQAMAGDAEGCRATVARALPWAAAHRHVLPWSEELLRFSGTFATLVADGPEAAWRDAGAAVDRATREVPATVGTWRFLAGFSAAVAGRLVDADVELGRAASELADHDLIGARPLAVAARAWAAAQAGEVARARDLLDASADVAVVDGRVRTQVAVADAWCDLADGGPSAALGKVRRAALDAADEGQVVSALIALHEMVRLGGAEQAVGPLRRISRGAPSSWLARSVVERAEAEAAADVVALDRLAARVQGRWPVVEAELHAVVQRLAVASGDEHLAARSAVAALRAASPLGAARPRTLAEVRSPLTEREHAVASAAARGSRSRDIAEATGVSVRTVENQLQSAYRKLGLSGRPELAELLGVDEDPASPAAAPTSSSSV